MNIKRAKTEIINTIKAYLAVDEDGNLLIPQVRQRPVFLIGAPGIGKTAIMKQIAMECGIGLVSYTMTHHTRQSALGLPFIEDNEYEDMKYKTTKYTMSEIIASVYEFMRNTKIKQGILFIDEINCVSETLAPVMLQFLQEKAFGNAKVPNGWIIVAAGNPQEYNKSVREFDVVTLDRVKTINIEADYEVWKEYAKDNMIHPAILSYLEAKKENFYKIQTTVEGKQFVTARGWQDLSDFIKAYEKLGIPVDEEIIAQYIKCPDVAADFANYLELFYKYEKAYCMEDILNGHVAKALMKRVKNAAFDEKISVISLMLCSLEQNFKSYTFIDSVATQLFELIKSYRNIIFSDDKADVTEEYIILKNKKYKEYFNKKTAGLLDNKTDKEYNKVNSLLNEWEIILKEEKIMQNEDAFNRLRKEFVKVTEEREKCIKDVSLRLENGFDFIENYFGENTEMLLFVTELAAGVASLKFIMDNGCDRFYKYNKEMLRDNVRDDLNKHIDSILTGG